MCGIQVKFRGRVCGELKKGLNCILRNVTEMNSPIEFGTATKKAHDPNRVPVRVRWNSPHAAHRRMCLQLDRSVTGVSLMRKYSGAVP